MPVVAQRYLPGVRGGDKRILLIEGEPVESALMAPKLVVRASCGAR
mgnify:CR=1 FL=1